MRNEKGQFVVGNSGKPLGAKDKIKPQVLKAIIKRLEKENKNLIIENEILKSKIAIK
jgi:hypothetical protein